MKDTYSTSYTLLNRACQEGDSMAWEELIGFYRQYIYVIIRSLNISPDDAEDVQQQVLVQLWKYLPSFDKNRKGAKFRFWLARVTRNQAINFLRKKQAENRKIDKASEEDLSDFDQVCDPEIEELTRKEWEIFITNRAMDNIRPHFSEKALESFALSRKGMKAQEVSEKLGVSQDSVYKYMSRIKLKLIEEIKHLKNELDF